MTELREVVITGVGVVSPIGIGREPFWNALLESRSGIHQFDRFQGTDWPVKFGARVPDFEPKQYVKPRKSLKVMSREVQMGFAAAALAVADAELDSGATESHRIGAIYGGEMYYSTLEDVTDPFRVCVENGSFDNQKWDRALAKFYPLWMLKYLPNMIACHVGISLDARGPNNTICLGEASGLLAMAEAASVIERNDADVMVCGGSGNRINPTSMVYRTVDNLSHRHDDPSGASRPFDADRDGMVNGEGAGALILESRAHAERRGATILGRVRGAGRTWEPMKPSLEDEPRAMAAAIRGALAAAKLDASEISHVKAHGLGARIDDAREARAIREVLGDVPVTAPKSLFGNLGGGGGTVEAVAAVLALVYNQVPPTRNYETPDPQCPLNVVHGRPLNAPQSAVLLINRSGTGQVAAAVLTAE